MSDLLKTDITRKNKSVLGNGQLKEIKVVLHFFLVKLLSSDDMSKFRKLYENGKRTVWYFVETN